MLLPEFRGHAEHLGKLRRTLSSGAADTYKRFWVDGPLSPSAVARGVSDNLRACTVADLLSADRLRLHPFVHGLEVGRQRLHLLNDLCELRAHLADHFDANEPGVVALEIPVLWLNVSVF